MKLRKPAGFDLEAAGVDALKVGIPSGWSVSGRELRAKRLGRRADGLVAFVTDDLTYGDLDAYLR